MDIDDTHLKEAGWSINQPSNIPYIFRYDLLRKFHNV